MAVSVLILPAIQKARIYLMQIDVPDLDITLSIDKCFKKKKEILVDAASNDIHTKTQGRGCPRPCIIFICTI